MSKINKIKPSILPGFMELLPREQLIFNSMLRTIQKSYELFGFVPIDTPIIEKAEILLAKGGEEAERQIYAFKKGDNDLALRFDLTVPLARYVSEHFNELQFPFRRYQIGKVYRGEKPQKGRFREFYQCDIDIIDKGKLDLVNDAEILSVIYATFKKLGLGNFLIRINNRKILTGFIQELFTEEKISVVLRLIDKLEKIGESAFIKELEDIGSSNAAINSVMKLLSINGDADSCVNGLKSIGIDNSQFNEGLSDLEEVIKFIKYLEVPESNWKVDLKIARGLEYYTGTVYETVLTDFPQLGSVCSGGRYDNLADYYTDDKLQGVGISIGFTRLFYQLNELDIFKNAAHTPSKILILPLEGYLGNSFSVASTLRVQGIATEVFTDEKAALRKKLDYANKLGVPYVGIIGENEDKDNKITLKNLTTGEQKLVDLKNLIQAIKNNL